MIRILTTSRYALSLFIAGLMISGCSDKPSDAGEAGSTTTAQVIAEDYGDGCTWLTAEEIEGVLGAAPDTSGPVAGVDVPGCHWKYQDGYQLLVGVMLSPRSISDYDSFDEYMAGMTERFGPDSVEGHIEITGLGGLAVFDPLSNMVVIAMDDKDFGVIMPRSVGGEEELVAIAKLALDRLQ